MYKAPAYKKTKQKPKPKSYFDPILRKHLVIEARELWNEICYDYLAICPKKKCKANEARSATADRMQNQEFFKLPRQWMDEVLKEAIPDDQYL